MKKEKCRKCNRRFEPKTWKDGTDEYDKCFTCNWITDVLQQMELVFSTYGRNIRIDWEEDK